VDLATRITLDDRIAPGKSQRPLTVPIRVPDDVRLSTRPSGGASEARAFLHELGVALFLSGIRAEGVESRRLGSPAASATWGYLVEALAAGADDFLMKPLDNEMFADKLRLLGLVL
jgi:hypothetical protein